MKAIDEVMATLKEEGQSDIDKRDQCKEDYQSIASKSSDIKWQIKNDVAKINKLQAAIEARTAEKAETIEAIAEVTDEIAKMESERIAENEAFLNAKSDDEAAIELLTSAKAALSKFYKKNTFLQAPVFEVSEDQAPEATFSDKGSRKNQSKGIVGLMEMLIEDLQMEVKNGKKGEAKAQTEFEAALKDAKTLKQELIEKKDTLEGIIAKREDEKTATETEKESDEADLKDQVDFKERITPDCDWMLGAFESRAAARAKEMQGLTSAKEFLAGAAGASALQVAKKPFDDNALVSNKFMGIH
jgi:hypothetical protein